MVDASVRFARWYAVLAALFVLGGGSALAVVALVSVDSPPFDSEEVVFFVNGFKFVVGCAALAAAKDGTPGTTSVRNRSARRSCRYMKEP